MELITRDGGPVYFAREELDYVARILRGAFEIRTANAEEDELLGDFIQALDEGCPIYEEENE
jgi:hypothetical protein